MFFCLLITKELRQKVYSVNLCICALLQTREYSKLFCMAAQVTDSVLMLQLVK